MNKGFIVNESLDQVKARVQKILDGAQGAFFNECFNSARGTLASGQYAQFGWTAKEDGTTVVTVEARSASDIEDIFGQLYAPEAEKEVPAEE